MDLHCTICGQPWDNEYMHDVAVDEGTSYEDVMNAFRREGCAALDRSPTWCRPNRRGALSAAMDDADAVLGGDDR